MADDVPHASLFATAIGSCAVLWRSERIVGASLPGSSEAALRRRLQRRWPTIRFAEPPAWVQAVVDDIVALLQGRHVDLRNVPLDLDDVDEFPRRVYELARTIPPGKTMTYGEIATALGDPAASRAVGQVLGANPIPIIVPCHRVIAAHGRHGGFSASGGTATKVRVLEIEGAPITIAPSLFDA